MHLSKKPNPLYQNMAKCQPGANPGEAYVGFMTYSFTLSNTLIFLKKLEKTKGFAPETLRHLPDLTFTVHFCSAVNAGIIKDAVSVLKKKKNQKTKQPPETPFSISHLR